MASPTKPRNGNHLTQIAKETHMYDSISQINWTLLREQKAWLIEQNAWQAWGLLSLLDDIQDEAVATGMATDVEVFGAECEHEF